MANQNQNNGNKTSEGFVIKDRTIAGLFDTPSNLNVSGVVYSETTGRLSEKIERLFGETFGISELVSCIMRPTANRHTNLITDMEMLFIFDTSRSHDGQANIWKGGSGKKRNNGTIFDYIGSSNGGSNFETSKHFKSTIGAVAVLNKDNRMTVQTVKSNRNLAIVAVEPQLVLELCTGVTENSGYSLNILAARPIGDGNEYSILMEKVIYVPRYNNRRNGLDLESIGNQYFRGGRSQGNNGGGNGNNNYRNNNNNYNKKYDNDSYDDDQDDDDDISSKWNR